MDRRRAGTAYGLYLRDLSHERTDSHGIVNHALGLAAALPAALADDERLVLLANREIEEWLPAGDPRVEVDARLPPPRGIARVVADQAGWLAGARRHGLAVLHFPKGFVPLVNPTRTKLVATVHDDIPVRYWEGAWGDRHRSAKTAYFAWNVRHAARSADAVLTVSEFTRAQLIRRWHGGDAVVTGQGVALPSTTFVPLHERSRALLHFGSSLPHKQSAAGLRRALQWIDDHPDAGLNEIHVLGNVSGLGQVTSHPRLRVLRSARSNAEVARLVAGSRALLFSSVYEGFGLPPLEASLLGTPVVFARIPAVEEVLGSDAVGGYDPLDARSFDDAMTAALAQDDATLQQRSADIAARHRWDEVAAATLAAYRGLARSIDR